MSNPFGTRALGPIQTLLKLTGPIAMSATAFADIAALAGCTIRDVEALYRLGKLSIRDGVLWMWGLAPATTGTALGSKDGK